MPNIEREQARANPPRQLGQGWRLPGVKAGLNTEMSKTHPLIVVLPRRALARRFLGLRSSHRSAMDKLNRIPSIAPQEYDWLISDFRATNFSPFPGRRISPASCGTLIYVGQTT